jgi:sugar phosphate isomerase/epimerase
MQRRQLLTACGSLGLTYLAAPLVNTVAANAPIDEFERRQPARLRLSLAAYSMRKYLSADPESSDHMDLFDFVDFCHEHGVYGAELTSYYFPQEVTREYLFDLKRHCHLRGVTISGGAIRNDFCSRDPEKIAADLEHTRQWVEHYALLGAPVIRIFAGQDNSEESREETQRRCAKHCETASRHAREHGVMLALENHGGITSTAEGLLGIVKQVDSDAFGVNLDSGNFHSTDDPYRELAMIAPYAINAQIKVEIQVDGEKQPTDLSRVAQLLRDAQYSGWVALEYEAAQEPREAIPGWLDQLKAVVDG